MKIPKTPVELFTEKKTDFTTDETQKKDQSQRSSSNLRLGVHAKANKVKLPKLDSSRQKNKMIEGTVILCRLFRLLLFYNSRTH